MKSIKADLLVIGAGSGGLSLASAAVQILLDQLRGEGVQIAEGALASEIRGKPGEIEVWAQDGRIFKGSHLLIAAGRKGNLERLNLAVAGIQTGARGIKVDKRLKTTNPRVYALGDVAGGLQFTHVAGYHAGIIIRSALLGLPATAKASHLPCATYTTPELAQVGLTEAEARKRYGGTLTVVRHEFAENDRAITERKAVGLIKVMVVRGRPVGASIVGAQAGGLIGLWALALANDLKMRQIAGMVAPYPTIGEVNKRAAGAYFSPRLFDSPWIKRSVRFVQTWLP